MPDVVWEFVSPEGTAVRKWHEVLAVDGDLVSYSTTYTSESWVEPVTFQSAQRFHDADTVSSYLQAAGLAIDEQFGHWDTRPFTDTSPEIVTIARRSTE